MFLANPKAAYIFEEETIIMQPKVIKPTYCISKMFRIQVAYLKHNSLSRFCFSFLFLSIIIF
jgi:hypothetical protein